MIDITFSRRCIVVSSIAGLLWIGGAASAADAARTITVHPDGKDTNPGTASSPLQTLLAARDRVRELRKGGRGPFRIVLREGTYLGTNVELAAADSGSPAEPLVIESHRGERATLVNGRMVPLASFAPVKDPAMLERLDPSARGKVVQLQLRQAGIAAPKPYADVFTGHGGMVQLLLDDRRLPLSRWPDDGYATMQTVVDSGIEPQPHGGTFVYAGDRPRRWRKAIGQGGVWLMGFWRVPWMIQAVRVAAIDDRLHTITLAAPVPLGIGSKYTPLVDGSRKGDGREPWYALNLLEEITRPGEWCVDFSSGLLFLWPPAEDHGGKITICDTAAPTITFASAKHVRLERIDFRGGLNEAIQVKDSSHLAIAGCGVSSTGGAGIRVLSGERVEIVSCDLAAIGAEAIFLASGVRQSLKRGESTLRNNHIHHAGELSRSSYAVIVEGVGNTIANNLIHDAPIGGIGYGGNDHLIGDNEIHNVGLDAGDVGAIYTNGDWASRGTVIRGNLVHHAKGVNGIYLDDGHGGDTVKDNILYRLHSGLFLGGGHDTIGSGNLVMECHVGIHLDDRGLDRNYTIGSNGALTRFLRQIDLAREPWKSHDPGLVKLLSHPDALPRPTGNNLTRNALVDCVSPWALPKGKRGERVRRENTLSPNWEGTHADAGIEGAVDLAFSLSHDSAVRKSLPGFPLPAAARSGLFLDRWRTKLPSDAETRRLDPRPPRKVFDSQMDVDAR